MRREKSIKNSNGLSNISTVDCVSGRLSSQKVLNPQIPEAQLRKRFLRHIVNHWVLNNNDLAEISAVYAIIAFDFFDSLDQDIVYVGSTVNLFQRYKSHKIPQKIKDSGKMNILFYKPLQLDRGLYEYELKLIKKLRPEYNVQHKKR